MTKHHPVAIVLMAALTAVNCAASPAVKRVEAVACADLAAVESLVVAIEASAKADPAVVAATRVAFVALHAVCSQQTP